MFSPFSTKAGYSHVEDIECDEELKLGGMCEARRKHLIIRTGPVSVLFLGLLFLSSIILTWVLFFDGRCSPHEDSKDSKAIKLNGLSWVCQQPTQRREWRRLSGPERTDYVTAVRCLATKPSKLRNNGSLYDDFPWVHKDRSSFTHKSAPFLPWHRQYIRLYEKALQEECSFDDVLPYWDWSLDWSDFPKAPVWDAMDGLGGDGAGSGSVGDGKCVTSGPFSDVEVMFYDGEVQRHCLSRGFASDEELLELGQLVHPKAISNLMAEDNFEIFASDLERRAHKFLSHSVKGDLSRFTGPNNPVFFLHHVNLDKIWAQWQRKDLQKRLSAYNGKASNHSEEAAGLTDILDMGGLSRNVQVADVMDTEGGQFCYGY